MNPKSKLTNTSDSWESWNVLLATQITNLIERMTKKVQYIRTRTTLDSEIIGVLINSYWEQINEMILETKELWSNKIKGDYWTWWNQKLLQFTNVLKENVPWYDSEYDIWAILFWLPQENKKYWDFPKPYSAMEFLEWCIAELKQMPNILSENEVRKSVDN